MATEVITGNTELVATKQALISSLIQKELKFKSKLLPTVTDLSAFAIKGAKSISFPKLTSFTVANRSSAVAGDIQALTSSVDTLDLNINAYVSFLIDSFDLQQTAIDAEMEYANRAAAALARYVDTQIISVLDAGAYLDVGAAPITADLILDAREQLLKSFADPAACVMVVGPDQEKVMLKITDFVRADAYGSSNIGSGIIGSVYGLPVMVHQGVTAGKAYWYSKDAVGIAFQKQITMAEQSEIAYGTGAKRVALDAVMGIKALQTGELGAGAGLSPLIVKM
jgi:N4-gp56 family major capsid protein